jgi:hypothetical protein
VRLLVRAIQDDQWKITHQPIALDVHGILIDGQHRVAAVAMAGLNVQMLIAYDADPETFDIIDTGRSRTPGATLAIAGYANTNVLAAASRYYLVYKDLEGTTKAPSGEPKNKFTPHDILRLMESHTGELLRGASSTAQRLSMALGRHGTVTWLAAAITLLDETSPDVQLRTAFLEALESGTMLEPGSAILALRRWIISDTGYMRMQKSYAGFAGMALFIKAWNYWLAGDHMQVASFRVTIEPLPSVHRNYVKGVDGKPADLTLGDYTDDGDSGGDGGTATGDATPTPHGRRRSHTSTKRELADA